MNDKKKVLGRGLSALIPGAPLGATMSATAMATVNEPRRGLLTLAIEKLVPNESQPRSHFDAEKLDELAQSIRENGVIQPILVRRLSGAQAPHGANEEY